MKHSDLFFFAFFSFSLAQVKYAVTVVPSEDSSLCSQKATFHLITELLNILAWDLRLASMFSDCQCHGVWQKSF